MNTLTALTLSFAVAATATAQIPSQTFEFTAAEGFTDGPANQQNGILAQKPVLIETTNGGRLTSPTKGHLRLVALPRGIDLNQLAQGETLTMVARGVRMRRELPKKRSGCMMLGLTFGTTGHQSRVGVGVQLLFDPQGRLWLDGQHHELSEQAVDTGLRYDQNFDATIVVTRTGPRAFTADMAIGNATMRTAIVDDVESLAAGMICQVQGETDGRLWVDALALNPTTLPGEFEEPE